MHRARRIITLNATTNHHVERVFTMTETSKISEAQSDQDDSKSNSKMSGTELFKAVLDGNPPAKGGPSWEEASSGEKRDRIVYIIGSALLAIGKAFVFVAAALFSAVFRLASKQNPRK